MIFSINCSFNKNNILSIIYVAINTLSLYPIQIIPALSIENKRRWWKLGTALSRAIRNMSKDIDVIERYCNQCIPALSSPFLSKLELFIFNKLEVVTLTQKLFFCWMIIYSSLKQKKIRWCYCLERSIFSRTFSPFLNIVFAYSVHFPWPQ